MEKNYTINIEQTKTGFSAYFDEIPVCTTGKDMQTLLSNMSEAYTLYMMHQAAQKALNNVETVNPPY